MEIYVVGSGTGIPSLKRGSPSLLVQAGGKNIVIDTGAGSLRELLQLGVSYLDVDYLCYTHTHPDHTADLVPFLFSCKHGEACRQKELKIIGGKGFKDFFDALTAVYGKWIVPQTYSINITELVDASLTVEGFRLQTKPMKHITSSIGLRIEAGGGKSITISGDTDYCPELVTLATRTDLLVLECSFPDEKNVVGHLTPALAGKIASESGCNRLLLIHFYPSCDNYDILAECRRQFQGEIIVGEDLKKIPL